jgi:3-methyladenine DNA glycosylase/8-oxoguanine DNA glycosylase
MVKLVWSSTYEIKPISPYNFNLTVRKPAGWPLFTPLEVYDKNTLWTAVHLNGTLVGLKLNYVGNANNPTIKVRIFLNSQPSNEKLEDIKKSLVHIIAADDDLHEFYTLAKKDSILKYLVADLHGMHSTSSGDTVFPDAILAILLQMAPLKRSNEMMDCVIRKYGEKAEFDNKDVYVWPLPQRIANLNPEIFAKDCRIGYRAKRIVKLSEKLVTEGFPTLQELEKLSPEDAKKKLLELPGIGDYSADIINPHGGFPIDVWSVEVFGKLFFGIDPENNRQAVEEVKREGIRRWGKWSWMAFFYVVQDLESLSKRLNIKLRLA